MFIQVLTHHPAIALYLGLAAVYAALSVETQNEGHGKAARLYGLSGLLHAGLAFSHWPM